MTDANHRAAVVERAARAGGVVARSAFRKEVSVETKRDKNDIVTEADHDAQAQVVATIRQEFPDDAFLLEEDAAAPSGPEEGASPPTEVDAVSEASAVWIVDPIDGTTNFFRGVRTWTTSVAAVVDGEAVAAATFMPAVDDVYAAGPESVTRNDESMGVGDRTDPETFRAAAVGWWKPSARDEFGRLCGSLGTHFADVRRLGSFQATLAYLAAGGLDAAVCTQPTNAWDTVAGVHLVRRAGGTVTNLDGERWAPDDPSLVASSGHAHDAVLGAARDAIEE